MKQKKPYVLVLASGGIDSTACIKFYQNMQYEVEAFFVDFGQAARIKEYKALQAIAKYYSINVNKLSLKNTTILPAAGEIIGRNGFLLFTALMNFRRESGLIAIGIHKGTNYYDCSAKFVSQVEQIFNEYSAGTVRIGAPFLSFNKREIWKFCKTQDIPVHLTYSCELGKRKPCGSCNTCKDLEALYGHKE